LIDIRYRTERVGSGPDTEGLTAEPRSDARMIHTCIAV
jgi:hypothetical protein